MAFKGLDKMKDLNPEVRAIRERLIKARNELKKIETSRDAILKQKYWAGMSVKDLMYQFGMTEANVRKVIDTWEK